MRTWMVEMSVVGAVLLAVAIGAGGGWVELVGVGAVLLSFGHAQVSDRLAEVARFNEERRELEVEAPSSVVVPLTPIARTDYPPPLAIGSSGRRSVASGDSTIAMPTEPVVKCFRWATRYLVAKELLWCIYFVRHGAWSALVGVGLFIFYPLWRQAWRKKRPLDRVSRSD